MCYLIVRLWVCVYMTKMKITQSESGSLGFSFTGHLRMYSFQHFCCLYPLHTYTHAHTHTHAYTGEAFDYLDGPLLRVTGADVPMPYASSLEKLALPEAVNVVNTACRLLNIA